MTTNKLNNGSFENGWYHPGNVPELQIPNGWEFDYADESVENPYDANPWAKFLRPEVSIKTREQMPDWEEVPFGMEGDFILKPFKGNGAAFFWFTQDVQLDAGEYELTIRVYPDVVMDYDDHGGKVFADDPNAALIRFGPGAWESINPVPSPHADDRLRIVKHRFVALGGMHQVKVEFMLPFPLAQNGLFCDRWELKQTEIPPVDPPPDIPSLGQPREQYQRSYVLMSPQVTRRSVSEIVDRFFDAFRFTFGGSADDAGIGALAERSVIAIQPQGWGDSLLAFYEQYYPGVQYLPVDGDNEYQLMGRVLASLLKARGIFLAYPVTHQPPHITSEFGLDRETYNHNGLDLRASYVSYQDYILAAHDGQVIHVGYDPSEEWFGYQVRTLVTLPDGQDMQVRYAHLVDGGAMVEQGDIVAPGDPIGMPGSTGNSSGDHLHIDVKVGADYADPAILIDWADAPEPPPPTLTVLGMHDESGAQWMMDRGIDGYALVHKPIHDVPEPVDLIRLEDAGVKVIMRWGYDYGGVGTVPPTAQTTQWISAMIHTINQSRGVYLHTLFNEWNNPTEWVGGYPNPDEMLTPGRVLDLYQQVAAGVRADVLLAPGAVDPFNVVAQQFDQPGDPRDWFDAMHNTVDRIDAIILHAKTQTNNSAECASNEEFSDAPLIGRYLHLRTYLDQLAWIRDDRRHLPVFITEVNPQRIDSTTLGWMDDNSAWVEAAVREIDRHNNDGTANFQPVTGLCFYRHDPADPWGLMNRPVILDEIARQTRRVVRGG